MALFASSASTAGMAPQGAQDLGELLRLLTPKPEASEEEEGLRASLIIQHATMGVAVPTEFESPDIDPDAADRLRALSILQGVFGGLTAASSSSSPAAGGALSGCPWAPAAAGYSGRVVAASSASTSKRHRPTAETFPAQAVSDSLQAPGPTSHPSTSSSAAPVAPCQTHELRIELQALPAPIRLLEVVSSTDATASYSSLGEEDPFGSKAWPAAYLCARRLLAEGVRGRSVLELGCGTGLVSVAARAGGASFVLATDRARPNVDMAIASSRLNGGEIRGEVFDVTLPYNLPSRSSPLCGNHRTPVHRASCADELPEFFDFLVFSDVLYWPKEAAAFGRRAAEAYAAGSTVVIADPGRRCDDFLGALREELSRRNVQPLPDLTLEPVDYPDCVKAWVSDEVLTASKLFCEQPFELVLRPPSRYDPAPASRALPLSTAAPAHDFRPLPVSQCPAAAEKVALPHLPLPLPMHFELVEVSPRSSQAAPAQPPPPLPTYFEIVE